MNATKKHSDGTSSLLSDDAHNVVKANFAQVVLDEALADALHHIIS